MDKFIEYKYQIFWLGNKSIPFDGVTVRVYDNIKGKGYPQFEGVTDADGYARDEGGRHPFLQPGTWYFLAERRGYIFSPVTHVVEGD